MATKRIANQTTKVDVTVQFLLVRLFRLLFRVTVSRFKRTAIQLCNNIISVTFVHLYLCFNNNTKHD